MTHVLIFLSLLSSFIPTKDKKLNEHPKPPSAIILNKAWNDAWNSHDSVAIASLIAKDAILADERLELKGINNIAEKFIHKYLNKIRNIRSTLLQTNSSNNIAYYFGTYKFDAINNKVVVGKEEGRFTFIWTKQADQSFRLSVIHMQSYSQKK